MITGIVVGNLFECRDCVFGGGQVLRRLEVWDYLVGVSCPKVQLRHCVIGIEHKSLLEAFNGVGVSASLEGGHTLIERVRNRVRCLRKGGNAPAGDKQDETDNGAARRYSSVVGVHGGILCRDGQKWSQRNWGAGKRLSTKRRKRRQSAATSSSFRALPISKLGMMSGTDEPLRRHFE